MIEYVNHPNHYNKKGRKECIEEMCDIFGVTATVQWAIITAHKYLYRAGDKEGNSYEQEISKAKWYLEWANNHLHMCGKLEIIQYSTVKDELKKEVYKHGKA